MTRSDVAGCAARDSRVQGGAPDQSIILRVGESMNAARLESWELPSIAKSDDIYRKQRTLS